jgi:hypothetical protein
MDQYSIKLQLKKIITIYGSHIDHMWTNASIQQCISRIVEAYWTNHKSIYFAFKLPNYISQYHHIDEKKNSLKNIDNNNNKIIMMRG